MDVHQHLLQHSLGLTIRVGRTLFRAFFCDRDLQRISIYCSRRTENNVFYTMFSHGITQEQCSCHIIMIIFNRLYHRLSNCLISCKMDDCIRLLCFKNLIHCRLIQHICLIKCKRFSGDLLYAVQCLCACIIKVIHNNYFISTVQKFYAGMTSNIACSPSY